MKHFLSGIKSIDNLYFGETVAYFFDGKLCIVNAFKQNAFPSDQGHEIDHVLDIISKIEANSSLSIPIADRVDIWFQCELARCWVGDRFQIICLQ